MLPEILDRYNVKLHKLTPTHWCNCLSISGELGLFEVKLTLIHLRGSTSFIFKRGQFILKREGLSILGNMVFLLSPPTVEVLVTRRLNFLMLSGTGGTPIGLDTSFMLEFLLTVVNYYILLSTFTGNNHQT